MDDVKLEAAASRLNAWKDAGKGRRFAISLLPIGPGFALEMWDDGGRSCLTLRVACDGTNPERQVAATVDLALAWWEARR